MPHILLFLARKYNTANSLLLSGYLSTSYIVYYYIFLYLPIILHCFLDNYLGIQQCSFRAVD
jgi:hypothetical protein